MYFIHARITNRLKIGIANDVDDRFNFLLRENADDLVLLGKVLGGYELEQSLHDELKELREHNEWFEYTDEAKELVARELSRSHSEQP